MGRGGVGVNFAFHLHINFDVDVSVGVDDVDIGADDVYIGVGVDDVDFGADSVDVREGLNEKKTFSFGPKSPNPPPDSNSGNLVLFFLDVTIQDLKVNVGRGRKHINNLRNGFKFNLLAFLKK